MVLKRIVKEITKIEAGLHKGIITDVFSREAQKEGKTFEYLDFTINLLGSENTIRFSVPDNLSPLSKLGELFERFGKELVPGEDLDIEGFFVNKNVQFMTTDKKGKGENADKTYATIIVDTVMPLKEKIVGNVVVEDVK